MGIDAYIETEDGEAKGELLDPDGLTFLLVSMSASPSSSCLRFIDPYGDTTFNQLQLPVLIKELQQVIDNSADPRIKTRAEALRELASTAKSEVHTYVKFYGD